MKLETLTADFSDEQKRYLEGFASGLQVGRGVGLPKAGGGDSNAELTGPEASHIKAQDRVLKSGRKLADP